MSDNFDAYFVNRAIKLLNRIEKSTAKSIARRDSEETIHEFGISLSDNISNNVDSLVQ